MDPITPNADPVSATTVPTIVPNTDPSVKFDSAGSARSPAAFYQIAAENPSTPIADASVHAASIISDGFKKLNDLTTPITDAGGVGTPGGNLAAVNQWKNVADDPQWSSAILKWLMGDKEGAALQVTGGNVKDNITFDNSGKRILEKINGLGQRVSVTDLSTGQPISPTEYQQRGGGFTSWENTLAGKSAIQTQESNVKSTQVSNATNNAWAASTASQAPLYQEMNGNLSQLKTDLPPKQYAQILQFAGNSIGQAANVSKNNSMLQQWLKGGGYTVGNTVDKQLATSFGFSEGAKFDAKGGITDTNGKHTDFSQLAMQNSGGSSSAENTKNFQQTQANMMQYAKTAGLSDEAVTRLQRTLEIAHQIGNDNVDMVSKYGKPLFLTLPGASTIMDKQGQVMAQTLQGQFNAEAMPLYQNYASQSLKDHAAVNLVPNPNEMEAGFTKTPEYMALQHKYAGMIQGVYNQSYVNPNAAPTEPATKPKSNAPAKPPEKKALADIFK